MEELRFPIQDRAPSRNPQGRRDLGTTIILKSGERTTGWTVFDVPEDANITAVTYELDSTGVDDARTGKCNLS